MTKQQTVRETLETMVVGEALEVQFKRTGNKISIVKMGDDLAMSGDKEYKISAINRTFDMIEEEVEQQDEQQQQEESMEEQIQQAEEEAEQAGEQAMAEASATNPAPRKPRPRKRKTLEEIQAKYPHVKEIIDIELADNVMEEANGDSLGVLHTSLPMGVLGWMSEDLMKQMEKALIEGKRKFSLVRIKCTDCDNERVIKSQDAFQVKRCQGCQAEHRKAKRRKK